MIPRTLYPPFQSDAAQQRGDAILAQSQDNSLGNTEPVVVRSAIVGIVTSGIAILAFSGLITDEQRQILEEQAGIIIPALALIVPIVGAFLGRLAAYSPRSAAKIAVANAGQPAGDAPTLDPPP